MKKIILIIILFVAASFGGVALSAVIFADSLEKLPAPILKADADPVGNPYNWFYNYRLTSLAETTDELLEATVGDDLSVSGESQWIYPSYNSASIGFATSKPTIARIEYGAGAYTHKTDISESYYFNHLHYLTGLQENTTYHYRIIYQDRDGHIAAGHDESFTTKSFADEIKLTNKDFPLQITAPGTYVLTEDIVSDTLGINIKSSNVVIDLNGHTLVYDNAAPTATPDPNTGWQYVETANMGIRAGLWNFVNNSIYNGTIRQGDNGGAGFYPLFLFHMGGATKNEVAGVTIDYYADTTPGMVTGSGYIHHNIVYDRGVAIADRHAGLRAISAGADSKVAYNSLRRFRHRGIDCGANCEVANNELYSDSYDTNSFAIGSGESHNIHDNKIFGMGYLFIGIGWGNGMTARDNIIYGRCYAPTQRSVEYARPSSVAGVRATNYYGTEFKNILIENNTIILKAEKSPVGEIGCTMARGLWVTNGLDDAPDSLIYRGNTIKVEAMPGNLDHDNTGGYYNNDVNYVIAPVSIQGTGWTETGIAEAIVVEDNHLITNVNHIVLGEGYGITNGARFYRNTLEKIDHDSEYFHPVRLGFWYWNTLGNKLIDTKWVNVGEAEIVPQFYGGTGRMDIKYGFTRRPQFVDQSGAVIGGQTITVEIDGGEMFAVTTDSGGYADFEVITTLYHKYGNSVEVGGINATPGQVDYVNYGFSLAGYESETVSTADLQTADRIILNKLVGSGADGEDSVGSDVDLPSSLPRTGSFYAVAAPFVFGVIAYLAVQAFRRY
jgi:hypothetical protein